MTKEEHAKILNDLKNCASEADRMNLIITLEKDYTAILGERDTAVTKATNAETECAKYAKLNNELWLSNNAQNKGGQAKAPQNENGDNNEPQKRTYEDLEKKFE